MINAKFRFHRRNAVKYVHRAGKSIKSTNMMVRFISIERPTSRVAIVVSKKVSKSAVVRNRIRRRVFSILRDYVEDIDVSTDIVFIIHDIGVKDMSHEDLKDEIVACLGRINGPQDIKT